MHVDSTTPALFCQCGCGLPVTRGCQFRHGHWAKTQAKPLEQRFWARVQKTEGCWLWTGARAHGRYGKVCIGGYHQAPVYDTHRISWELHFGPIPEGLLVCHHCDNPACVRPDHLFLGTDRDNTQDMIRKGRDHLIGSRQHLAKLTEADIPVIRRAWQSGETQASIARRYGMRPLTIGQIVRGERWRHVKS